MSVLVAALAMIERLKAENAHLRATVALLREELEMTTGPWIAVTPEQWQRAREVYEKTGDKTE